MGCCCAHHHPWGGHVGGCRAPPHHQRSAVAPCTRHTVSPSICRAEQCTGVGSSHPPTFGRATPHTTVNGPGTGSPDTQLLLTQHVQVRTMQTVFDRYHTRECKRAAPPRAGVSRCSHSGFPPLDWAQRHSGVEPRGRRLLLLCDHYPKMCSCVRQLVGLLATYRSDTKWQP